MKITLKKGSVGATAGIPADPTAPPAESSEDTPVDTSAEVTGEGMAQVPLEAGDGVVGRRKGINIFGIIFAVVGFLAVAVFVTLLVLQGSEISFYKGPESLWLK
jgi:hypothetical protein